LSCSSFSELELFFKHNVAFIMAAAKSSADHIEDIGHEAVLTGVVALANLFSLCVETFGLIHPSHKWDKEEQRQIARLGLQQTRLLVWGYVLGIASPPASVTDRAVPRNPSLVYPEPSEPTFFGARDPRLDEPGNRTIIEDALSAIVDRTSCATREEMMAKYGLKPPRKVSIYLERPLDPARLEAFRERLDLLHEVAEKYAHIDTTRRAGSLVRSSWHIADCAQFAAFITATQERIDMLIDLLNVKPAIDRAVSMDIRSFGWHVIPDPTKTNLDIAKLRLLHDICVADYPEYLPAVQQALDHIGREHREFSAPDAEKAFAKAMAAADPNAKGQIHSISEQGHLPSPSAQQQDRKRPGLLGLLRHSFTRSSAGSRSRRSSLNTEKPDMAAARSRSDAGVTYSENLNGSSSSRPTSAAISQKSSAAAHDEDHTSPLSHMRSKSLSDAPSATNTHFSTSTGTSSSFANATGSTSPTGVDPADGEAATPRSLLAPSSASSSLPAAAAANHPRQRTAVAAIEPNSVIRHDQYRGLARTETRDLHQGNY
jgi:hypothetical protein